LVRSFYNSDMVDLISNLYCFTTGSMRVTINDALYSSWMFGLLPTSQDAQWFTNNTLSGTGTNVKSIVNGNLGEPLDLIVPPYQQTMGRSVIGSCFNNNGTYSLASSTVYAPAVVVQAVNYATTTVTSFRTPADDSNCWGFLSIPAMVLMSTT